jgi:hypothetical protein
MANPWSDETPIEEYFVFVRRVMAKLAERVGAADVVALAEMAEIRRELDDHITSAVVSLRADLAAPATWQEIADALGMSRGGASVKYDTRLDTDRYAKGTGSRRQGGQPAHWR